jgi:hypothetical protein|tara:strand:- start:883 stop:1014 length:132 start_codon:yes stop_codon:yes gene_type:complete
MTFKDDLLRIAQAEITALRGRVQELEAKLEVLNQEQWNEKQGL